MSNDMFAPLVTQEDIEWFKYGQFEEKLANGMTASEWTDANDWMLPRSTFIGVAIESVKVGDAVTIALDGKVAIARI